MKVGIISDTHGYIDDRICAHLSECDEIWHAGDIGDLQVTDRLQQIAPLRAVYGNIDGGPLRWEFPEEQLFDCKGIRVWMTHIGGYPPKYTTKLKKRLDEVKPDLFICGHSHILKVIPDTQRNLLHINPGAAGLKGFHKVRTLILIEVGEGRVEKLNVVELGTK
ncbi:metallophosphoesterase family protein [Algivirga pacifica]|uniref:Phosphoesterase n=1 Tax=Algivirga pacifica TaxID=1162670 RepID=A0ABP9D674_9BACT